MVHLPAAELFDSLVAHARSIQLLQQATSRVQFKRLRTPSQELLSHEHLRHCPLASDALQRCLHL